jgi:glutamine amidotransferase
MPKNCVVVDYGMGNLNSVRKKLHRLKANAVVSSDREDISRADKIILPGVGQFKEAMLNLERLNLIGVLNEAVLERKKPVLGICLGMQLMARKSDEGNTDGLGWIDAEVRKFAIVDTLHFKIPHMGWNQIKVSKASELMKGIPDSSEFYFVHSYFIDVKNSEDILNETAYEKTFTSAIEKENIFGVQYHPEKSHEPGETLLKNFVEV